jgi:D-alanyl-D-alanine dipeptidase
MLLKISPDDLVNMNTYQDEYGYVVDLAYTQDYPKSFCGIVYHPRAQLWLHKDVAEIMFLAAHRAREKEYILVLYDGLRTKEAQALMGKTPLVQDNPSWLEGETRMISPPGKGAHPRGMAIDCSLMTLDGALLDMGARFDQMPDKGMGPGPETNAAHRQTSLINDTHRTHRALLDDCVLGAARALGKPFIGIAQEWWDYRMPPEIYEQYEALSDNDLRDDQKMALI